MRVSRTPLALVALLFLTACASDSLLAPAEKPSPDESGTWLGTGNRAAPDTTLERKIPKPVKLPTEEGDEDDEGKAGKPASGTWIGTGN